MADIIRDAVIRIGLEQVKADLQAPDLTPLRQASEQAAKEAETTSRKVADQARQTANQVVQASQQQVAAVGQVVEANLRVSESLKAAGEGAFTLARGIAFVAASSEQDLQKALQVVAAFQGAFDIFKGGVELTKGLAEANKALTAATTAATAAESVHAVAITATGASAARATPQVTAFSIATGPIGIAVLAISAALAAGVALWRQYGQAADDASGKLRQARDNLAQLRDRRRQQIFADDPARELDVRRNQLASAQFRFNTFGDQSALADGFDAASRARELVKQNIEAAKQQVEEAKKLGIERERAIEQQKRSVELARQQVVQERDKVQSIQAQIGSLNELDRAELKRIADKKARGERLSDAELARAGQLGGGITAGFVQSEFARRGSKDADDIAGKFDYDIIAKQEEAQRRARADQSKLDTLADGRSPEQALSELAAERDKAIAEAQTTLERQTAVFDALSHQLDRIIKRLDEIEGGNL